MNDLLFTALILALLYYFFYYLPQQKSLKSQTISTQTDPFTNPELKELQSKNQELTTELKSKDKDYQTQITKLQTEIRELAKRPVRPTNSKGTQTDSETELTNTLDTLIKGIQELNNSL